MFTLKNAIFGAKPCFFIVRIRKMMSFFLQPLELRFKKKSSFAGVPIITMHLEILVTSLKHDTEGEPKPQIIPTVSNSNIDSVGNCWTSTIIGHDSLTD